MVIPGKTATALEKDYHENRTLITVTVIDMDGFHGVR